MSSAIFFSLCVFLCTKDLLSGVNIIVLRTVLKPFSHDVKKTELAAEGLTLNQFARCCKVRLSLSFIKQSNISSLAKSFLAGPNRLGILLKYVVTFLDDFL